MEIDGDDTILTTTINVKEADDAILVQMGLDGSSGNPKGTKYINYIKQIKENVKNSDSMKCKEN